MDKKKLGLINKNKLELRKTVGSGTVKQSFSHGRVKSVAVEVKKVRTFAKNNSPKNEIAKENTILNPENKLLVETDNTVKPDSIEDSSSKDKLEKIKKAAHSNKIDRENKISSRQEEEFRNKKYQTQKIKNTETSKKLPQNNKFQTNNIERVPSTPDSDSKREDASKMPSSL